MDATEFGIFTLLRFTHHSNAPGLISASSSENSTEVRLGQPPNADGPIVFTPEMSMLTSDVHLVNAFSDIVETLVGILTAERFEHSQNAWYPIDVTPFGSSTDNNPVFLNTNLSMIGNLLGRFIELSDIQA